LLVPAADLVGGCMTQLPAVTKSVLWTMAMRH